MFWVKCEMKLLLVLFLVCSVSVTHCFSHWSQFMEGLIEKKIFCLGDSLDQLQMLED